MNLISTPIFWVAKRIAPLTDTKLFDNPIGRFLINFLNKHAGEMMFMNGVSSIDSAFCLLSYYVLVALPPYLIMDIALTAILLGLRVNMVKEMADEYLELKIPITDTSPIPKEHTGSSYTKSLGHLFGIAKPDEPVVAARLPLDNSTTVIEHVTNAITLKFPPMSRFFGFPPQELPPLGHCNAIRRHRGFTA